MEIQQAIRETMARARQQGYERVYPYQVQAFIGIVMDVSTIRRYMARMAEQGEIRRLGERKGYTLAYP